MVGIMCVMPMILHRPELLREGVFALSILGFFVGYYVTGQSKAKLDFYVVTAQVVPALFIALAVEIHAFMRRHRGEDRRAAVVVALALALAEFESLRAVASGDRDEASFAVVVGALVAAAVGLGLPVLLEPAEPVAERPDAVASPETRVNVRWTQAVALALLRGGKQRE